MMTTLDSMGQAVSAVRRVAKQIAPVLVQQFVVCTTCICRHGTGTPPCSLEDALQRTTIASRHVFLFFFFVVNVVSFVVVVAVITNVTAAFFSNRSSDHVVETEK